VEMSEGCPDGLGLSSTHRGRAMGRCREVFVGIDTAKARNAAAIAEAGRQGEVRYLAEIDNTPDAVAKLVASSATAMRRYTSVTRPDPRATVCIDRSSPWDMAARWLRRR
jgi:hypothetical protein